MALDLAVAAATGASSGSAHTIATLLLPEMMNETIDNDIRWDEAANVEDFEGVACFHHIGQHAHIGRYEIGIGIDDSLVRKVTFFLMGVLREEMRREIKVVQSLIRNVHTDERDQRIVRSLIAQSYHFARPLAPGACITHIQACQR